MNRLHFFQLCTNSNIMNKNACRINLEQYLQFDWMNGLQRDRPTQPWTVFKAGETE